MEDSSPEHEDSDVDSPENTSNEYVEESYYKYVSQYKSYNLVKVPLFVKSKWAFGSPTFLTNNILLNFT